MRRGKCLRHTDGVGLACASPDGGPLDEPGINRDIVLTDNDFGCDFGPWIESFEPACCALSCHLKCPPFQLSDWSRVKKMPRRVHVIWRIGLISRGAEATVGKLILNGA